MNVAGVGYVLCSFYGIDDCCVFVCLGMKFGVMYFGVIFGVFGYF